MDARTAHALIRFGLGRQGAAALPGDPLGWLAGQLDGPDLALALPAVSSAEVLRARREINHAATPEDKERLKKQYNFLPAATATATLWLLDSASPFRERLVWFWANHFTVSRRRGDIAPLLLPYVREAIRPHVTGSFAEMLLAAMRHPAMLMYLDNTESIGPESPAGLKQHRGLNENLARECLELHTVGPAAGYSQRDVTEFAKVLTGWTIAPDRPVPGFDFVAHRHQPGMKAVMGHLLPEGEAGGVAALDWLGHHPATYRHIAAQLVQHFAADDPSPADVGRIAAVLGRTGGNLKAASLELLHLPSAWQPLTKLRAPWDYAVAALRALDLPEDKRPDLPGAMAALGQPWMAAPLPNGWADTAAVWADGELLLRRADWAMALAGRAPALEPMAVAETSLGALLGDATRQAVLHAPSRREALALLLASPEFQRR